MNEAILSKKIERLTAKKNSLTQRAMNSTDVNEVRSIYEELSDVNKELKRLPDIGSGWSGNPKEQVKVIEWKRALEKKRASIKKKLETTEETCVGPKEERKTWFNAVCQAWIDRRVAAEGKGEDYHVKEDLNFKGFVQSSYSDFFEKKINPAVVKAAGQGR